MPNGEIAVIPGSWFSDYSELFALMEPETTHGRIKRHHLALIQDLQNGNLAKVTMDRKLQKLQGFEEIDDYAMSQNFKRSTKAISEGWLQLDAVFDRI